MSFGRVAAACLVAGSFLTGAATAAPVEAEARAFVIGQHDSYDHTLGFLGLPKERAVPAGTTLSAFYARDPHYRLSYAAGAAYGFARIASALGNDRASGCFLSIAPTASRTLDRLTSAGAVSGRTGVLATIRRLCVSDDSRFH